MIAAASSEAVSVPRPETDTLIASDASGPHWPSHSCFEKKFDDLGQPLPHVSQPRVLTDDLVKIKEAISRDIGFPFLPAPAVTGRRASQTWPNILAEIFVNCTTEELLAAGVSKFEWLTYVGNVLSNGATVAKQTKHAVLIAGLLKDDPDRDFLVRTAALGGAWSYTDPPDWYEVENYVSEEHVPLVDDVFSDESTAGRVIDASLLPLKGLSAVGCVLKERKGKLKVRQVHDLSRPFGSSVNDGVSLKKDTYAKVSDACGFLRPGFYLGKVDLEKAYRSVPLAMQLWLLHGFLWDGKRRCDTRLQFGHRASPSVFNRFTQAIVRFMTAQGFVCIG